MQGFYNVIKPTGVSSAYVVSKIKKITREKRVGHMGTLDPAASGVLTIAVGKATRFFDYFLNKDKHYFAIAEFGVQTDTLDSEGNILINDPFVVSESDIKNKLSKFIGEIEQCPPIYSAVNINGKRAYELARLGENIDMPIRKVNVYDFQLVYKISDNKYAFRVHCSAGTYIRTLLSDLANSLGTVANVPVIIREGSGNFFLNNASTLDEIKDNFENKLIKIEDVIKLKQINFKDSDVKSVLNGVKIKNRYDLYNGEEFLGYVNNKLFGLFACDDGQLLCKINLYEGE